MRRRELFSDAEVEVGLFNGRNPVGVQVRFWPGAKDGPGRVGCTRSEAFLSLSGRPAVLVTGQAGYIDLAFVEVIEERVSSGWFPQQGETRS